MGIELLGQLKKIRNEEFQNEGGRGDQRSFELLPMTVDPNNDVTTCEGWRGITGERSNTVNSSQVADIKIIGLGAVSYYKPGGRGEQSSGN